LFGWAACLVQQKIWEPKKGFFGRSGRYVDKVVWSGRGWILGEFKWERPAGNHLTALLNESRDKLLSTDTWLNCGFVRVQPYSEGYQDLSSGHAVGKAFAALEPREVDVHAASRHASYQVGLRGGGEGVCPASFVQQSQRT